MVVDLTGLPASDILELFGVMFFEFCQESGYSNILEVTLFHDEVVKKCNHNAVNNNLGYVLIRFPNIFYYLLYYYFLLISHLIYMHNYMVVNS